MYRGHHLGAAAALITLAQPTASAPAAPGCVAPEYGVYDIWGAPQPIEPIDANRPIILEPDAILAREVVQIATRMWRLKQPLPLAGDDFTYPARARVTAVMSARGEERCLRDGAPRMEGPRRGKQIPCLLDEDKDGRFETVELFATNALLPYEGTRPRFQPLRRIALSAPVSMDEDPQGIGASRLRLHRRLRAVRLTGDRLQVAVEHATQSARALISYPPDGKEGVPVPPGDIEFRPRGEPREIVLADGAVVTIGGLAFRLGRRGGQWTATPLAPAFPEWLAFGCGRTTVSIRPIPL